MSLNPKLKKAGIWSFWIVVVLVTSVVAVYSAMVMRDGTFDPMIETTHHGH